MWVFPTLFIFATIVAAGTGIAALIEDGNPAKTAKVLGVVFGGLFLVITGFVWLSSMAEG